MILCIGNTALKLQVDFLLEKGSQHVLTAPIVYVHTVLCVREYWLFFLFFFFCCTGIFHFILHCAFKFYLCSLLLNTRWCIRAFVSNCTAIFLPQGGVIDSSNLESPFKGAAKKPLAGCWKRSFPNTWTSKTCLKQYKATTTITKKHVFSVISSVPHHKTYWQLGTGILQ